MKIINQGKNENQEFVITCAKCGFSAQVNDKEFSSFTACPNCGAKKNNLFKDGRSQIIERVEDIDDKIIDAFPNEYYHYGASETSKKLSTDQTKELIKKTIKNIKTCDDKFAFAATGDTIVFCIKNPNNEDNYEIFVCKSYYEYVTGNESEEE